MAGPAPLDVTIITGMSGAGRSEAAHVLEDLGFFVIDNMPPSLISKVAELALDRERPVRYGLVVDVRSGDFLAELRSARAELASMGARVRILFLDASDEVLVRRYEASRRRHPLSASDRVSDGIADERELLEELRGEADILIDTSNLNVHELRERLRPSFADDASGIRLQASIVSFGYKHGLPLDVDLVFDCRFLPNPHWIEALRPLTGIDEPVRDYVLSQPETGRFLEELDRLFALLLPAFEKERKSYLSIGVGCTGGQHRSVVLAEELARLLAVRGYLGAVFIIGTSGVVEHNPTGYESVLDVDTAALDSPPPIGPSVVALGGGHGLSIALHAARRYAGSITAVVSVADDGGSSGRLRRDLDVPAPGDLRKCLVALAGESTPWAQVFEHRFQTGELEGHALGNLLIIGLTEALGDLPTALHEAGRLVEAVGRVLPATVDPVVIKADVDGEQVLGQVAVSEAGGRGRIRGLHLVPRDVAACPEAVDAIAHADQILVGPGSLYTSLLAVSVVPEIRLALALARGRIVQIANLRTESPETAGLDGTDHALAMLEHRVRIDTFLYDAAGPLAVNDAYLYEHGVMPVGDDLADDGSTEHDIAKLATALRDLL